ncbi:DUF3048 domain-containing protein [Rathayibacter sp. YIM 133350]|uniref:DUF3048 domain-containing protein n=1 Tax=Rathayibacter sp. YIM 133350 TaxID=3131992 RepID=UPI00307DD142
MPRFAAAGMLVALGVLLAGCTGGAPSVTATPPPSGSAYVSDYSPPAATQLAPLRGTTVPAGSLAHPSLAAKIDNHVGARPQVGLERTDIVFEELVEGGLTRYVALWHSDIPDLIGPVRSIRPMDPDIITPFGGIVAYSGGQEQFVAMMQATPVLNVVFDYDDTGLFYRDDVHDSPHDVILHAKDAVDRHSDLAPPAQQFAYSTDAATSTAAQDGAATASINAVFSDERFPSFSWDDEHDYWLRSQEGAPDVDSNGDQLHAVNVVTLRVGIDWRYGEVPKTVMVGGGEAWFSTGGKTLHGTWSKADQAAGIRLADENGTTVRLAPGNTWIELVPTDGGSVAFG